MKKVILAVLALLTMTTSVYASANDRVLARAVLNGDKDAITMSNMMAIGAIGVFKMHQMLDTKLNGKPATEPCHFEPGILEHISTTVANRVVDKEYNEYDSTMGFEVTMYCQHQTGHKIIHIEAPK